MLRVLRLMSSNESRPQTGFGWPAILALAIGCASIAGALICTVRTAQFLARASKTSGEVIAMHASSGGKGGVMYRPIFTFTNGAGTVQTQRSSMNFAEDSFQPPQSVTVLYNPSNPEDARIDSLRTLWLTPFYFTVWGALWIAGPLVVRRKRARAS